MIKKTFRGREEHRTCSSCRGLYIKCKRAKPLKLKRFTVIVTRLEELTKNRCSQYNIGNGFTKRVSVVGEGDVAMGEKMEKKLSTVGKVNIKYSGEIELGEEVEKELRYIIENNNSKWVIALEVFCFTLLYKNKLK